MAEITIEFPLKTNEYDYKGSSVVSGSKPDDNSWLWNGQCTGLDNKGIVPMKTSLILRDKNKAAITIKEIAWDLLIWTSSDLKIWLCGYYFVQVNIRTRDKLCIIRVDTISLIRTLRWTTHRDKICYTRVLRVSGDPGWIFPVWQVFSGHIAGYENLFVLPCLQSRSFEDLINCWPGGHNLLTL